MVVNIRTSCSISVRFVPKMLIPSNYSRNSTPADHTSTFDVYRVLPSSISGARYGIVTTRFVYPWRNEQGSQARLYPKSSTLTSPPLPSTTLEAFISLCRTLRSCISTYACKMWYIMYYTCGILYPPSSPRLNISNSPSLYLSLYVSTVGGSLGRPSLPSQPLCCFSYSLPRSCYSLPTSL
uniref:Uncharacterized protein n=1 Tax=Lygus hesperus TaxID=30085 RepID=A0A146M812_LYGHE